MGYSNHTWEHGLFSVRRVGMKWNALWRCQHILKLVVNHGMKHWSRTRSAIKPTWYVTTVQDEWPCKNECYLMDITKQQPSWIAFPVSAVWHCNLEFGWRSTCQRTICKGPYMPYAPLRHSHFSS